MVLSSDKPGVALNEELLIARIAKSSVSGLSKAAGLQKGIGDDAAIWRPRPGCDTVLTTDWFLEGIHFWPDRHPADSVGWKCLARAASDIAAMGGIPRCFLLSLALPNSRTQGWLDGFLKGLRLASQSLRCPLAGGDTTRHQGTLIHLTVIGEIPMGQRLLRSGARPGHAIFVTGRLGEAEYGLRRLERAKKTVNSRDSRLQKHFYPHARIAAAQRLALKMLPTAMMDLSDGLSSDLKKLCGASGVGAQIELSRLPMTKIARKDQKRFSRLDLALHGGDDYELLFTVAKKDLPRVPRSIGGLRLTRIGVVTKDKRIETIDQNGQKRSLPAKGWDPFR